MDKSAQNNAKASGAALLERDVESAPLITPPASISDFDFLVGVWRVRHHRLVGRLAGSTTWQDFDGETRLWGLLGG